MNNGRDNIPGKGRIIAGVNTSRLRFWPYLLVYVLALLVDVLLISQGIRFPWLYAMPILLIAWKLGWRGAVLTALVSALGHFVASGAFDLGVVGVFVLLAAVAVAVDSFAVIRLFAQNGRAWRSAVPPQALGARVSIVAASSPVKPGRPDEILLRMDSGLAFGSGSHPTTRLCVGLIEGRVKGGERVFDLGTGTGVLALAALALGAQNALCADIDPEAVARARENAGRNGFADRMTVKQGSLDVARAAWPDDHFDLVIANILADVLTELIAQGLPGFVAPGGALLLSGIKVEQVDLIQTALRGTGYTIAEQREREGWLALIAEKR